MHGGGPSALSPSISDGSVDDMISMIAHELTELSSNPFVNAWYCREDPVAPLYNNGGRNGYTGQARFFYKDTNVRGKDDGDKTGDEAREPHGGDGRLSTKLISNNNGEVVRVTDDNFVK
ncbi:hypothetical protein RJ639_044769 [Escallonia herrerae]|uniref:Uncharacterized protein n=1 Tax=Escallonia herrerae TaxID=1293975 RepID=A0AA89B224_9ASTE|nr:hypothetical protein RJ639_044769 [Escallonia herrerae]